MAKLHYMVKNGRHAEVHESRVDVYLSAGYRHVDGHEPYDKQTGGDDEQSNDSESASGSGEPGGDVGGDSGGGDGTPAESGTGGDSQDGDAGDVGGDTGDGVVVGSGGATVELENGDADVEAATDIGARLVAWFERDGITARPLVRDAKRALKTDDVSGADIDAVWSDYASRDDNDAS